MSVHAPSARGAAPPGSPAVPGTPDLHDPLAADASGGGPDASSDPGRRRLLQPATLRRHLAFLVVLAAGLAVRIVATVAYRPGLLFRGDSYGYLQTALHLHPGVYRPAVYPILLWPFVHLRLLGLVVPLQHLLGLGLGVAVYLTLLRLGVRPGWAAIGAAPVLLDAYQVDIEQFFMAETLFEAFLAGAVAVAVWRRRPSVAACATVGALIAGAGLARTVGLFVSLPMLGYLVGRRVGILRVGAAVAGFAVPLLMYAAWNQAVWGQYALTGRDAYFLYGRVAPFADCRGLDLTSSERVLCDPRPPAERNGPNFYVWSVHSPIRRIPLDPEARNGVLRSFALRVIEHQPLDYLGVIGGDLLHYLEPGRATDARQERVAMWQFPTRLPALGHVNVSIPAATVPPGTRGSGNPGLAGALRDYQRVAYTPGPLLALALALGLFGAVGLCPGAPRRLRSESLLLATSGLIVLVVPAATVMFDYRYLLPALVLLPPAGVLGAKVLAVRLRHGRRASARRPRPG